MNTGSKEQFEEGVHYFKVTGDALRRLKSEVKSSAPAHTPLIGKFASCLYLWTEQGAMLHCKMFNTLNALAIMEQLRADYFNQKPVMTPQVFNHPQFGNLRTILIDGEPFFVGKDVAAALGYKNSREALQEHVPDKFKKDGVAIYDPIGREQFPVLINEAGLYKLVMRSRLPKAEEFSDWACGEVLPSIRKHGFYSTKPVEESLFPDEPVKAKKKRRPLPEYAVVYVARLSNALVKIGLTTDFNRRIKEVRKETGLDVEEIFTTGNMPLDDARKLESTVKAKFHDKNTDGELYDAPFEQLKIALSENVKAAIGDNKFDKLLALANILPDSKEKTQLVIQAASLL